MPISSRPPPAPSLLSERLGADTPAALEHPLPAGMRDLLPAEAGYLSGLARRTMETFELFGYERVSLPAFEYAEVLERGLGALEPDRVLRFVEPESGEVVALRPDVTPQIARMVATRLADEPPPARLCYEGSVLRRRPERARLSRQIPQAGCELVGASGGAADLEVLSVAAAAVRSAGLRSFVIDLGHARIAATLLADVDRAAWPPLLEALSVKDASALSRRALRAGLDRDVASALAALPELSGGEDVWPRAEKILAPTAAIEPMRELRELWAAACSVGLAPDIVVDLGEVWNFEYYTSWMFQILAAGPGEPVGSGGRYDGLFARLGPSRAAAGLALDLDNLGWALRDSGEARSARTRVLVRGREGKGDADLAAGLLDALRAARVACAPAPAGDALAYARAWRYSHLVEVARSGCSVENLADGARHRFEDAEADALAARIAACVEPERSEP